MTNRLRDVGINIRVTPDEKKKITRYAKKCRLSVSEYLRQLAMKAEPKALPPQEIEQSILRINAITDEMQRDISSDSDPVSRKITMRYMSNLYNILIETLELMRGIKPNSEENNHGDD